MRVFFKSVGLLIDSERVYTEVANSFLEPYGKGPITAEIKTQLMSISVTY